MPNFMIIRLGVLEKIVKVLAIYGHGGHVGHVTKIIFTKFLIPLPKEAPHKFGFDWPIGFEEEKV